MIGTLYSETEMLDSHRIKELYDESVIRTKLRMPRARIREDASPAILGEGPSAFYYWPAAEKYYREAYFARAKMGERPKKFPIIDGKYARNIPKIPILWGISELSKYGMNALQDNPDMVGQLIYGLLGMANAWSTQLYKSYFISGMPLVAAYKGFAEGQSKINGMATIEVGEYELPIFKYQSGLANADIVRMIKDNFEIDVRGGVVISRYNRTCGEWVNNDYLARSAEKETRGDLGKLVDPNRAKSWFVRNYTWHMQQWGGITDSAPITVPGGSFDLKAYSRPHAVSTFLRNLIGDNVYDYFDAPFDMLHAAGFEVIPPVAQQAFKEWEYKSIQFIVRGLTRNPSRNRLRYDLPISYVQIHAPAIYFILTS